MNPTIKIEDTIAAVASAISLGKGGIAVLRVSGNNAIKACKDVVETKSKFAWSSHRVFHGFVKDPEEGKIIEEGTHNNLIDNKSLYYDLYNLHKVEGKFE